MTHARMHGTHGKDKEDGGGLVGNRHQDPGGEETRPRSVEGREQKGRSKACRGTEGDAGGKGATPTRQKREDGTSKPREGKLRQRVYLPQPQAEPTLSPSAMLLHRNHVREDYDEMQHPEPKCERGDEETHPDNKDNRRSAKMGARRKAGPSGSIDESYSYFQHGRPCKSSPRKTNMAQGMHETTMRTGAAGVLPMATTATRRRSGGVHRVHGQGDGMGRMATPGRPRRRMARTTRAPTSKQVQQTAAPPGRDRFESAVKDNKDEYYITQSMSPTRSTTAECLSHTAGKSTKLPDVAGTYGDNNNKPMTDTELVSVGLCRSSMRMA